MSPSNADRNLLLGILAYQNALVTRDALFAGMQAWLYDKTKSLAEILQNQGALDAERRQLLEAMVGHHLKQHGGDPQRSLQAVSSASSVRGDLEKMPDPDLQASLAHLSKVRDDDDPYRTRSMAGTPTSAGTRFRRLRPHAKGGLGEVFVALDSELNREVALKEIQDRHADEPESRSRFLQEAEITGGLEHPGIVPVYGLGTYADGRPFYAMRFIRGDSLMEAIAKYHKPPSPKPRGEYSNPAGSERNLQLHKLVRRLIDVCNALQYAHDRGVLHRDLKPGNIMLGKYGETLVVDWGLAKASGGSGHSEPQTSAMGAAEPPLRPASGSGSAETMPGSALGTPEFMSPEQAAGRLDLLGPASDIYCLGATLYCLLTGRPPLKGDAVEVLKKAQQGDFLRPRQIDPAIARPLEAVCLKAMALNPENRYVSPLQLAEDLEHWLADEPVKAWPDPWTVTARRWTNRHRTPAAALGSALLVALVTLTTATVLLSAANEAERESTGRAKIKEAEARDNAAKATESEKQANVALEEVEALLTENLLRPIGHRPGPPDLIETEALWKLAALPRSKLRLRVIEQGLEKRSSAQRLVYRADMAAHAAVGLDVAKQQALLRVVLGKLRLPDTDLKVQEACVLIAMALDQNDDAFTGEAARVLATALAQISDFSFEIAITAEAINALAEKLGKAEAVLAARALVQPMHNRTLPDMHRRLVPALTAVAGRLGPTEAAPVAGDLAELLTGRVPGTTFRKNSDPRTVPALAQMLVAVAVRLGPDEAGRLAMPVARELGTRVAATDKVTLQFLPQLCGALTAVSELLSADEKRKTTGLAARVVVAMLGKVVGKKPLEIQYQSEMLTLVAALEALGDAVGAEDATVLSEALLRQMDITDDNSALNYLGNSLAAVAGRLDADPAAPVARTLVARMSQTKYAFALPGLSKALAAAAKRLTPAEAMRVADALVDLMKATGGEPFAVYKQMVLAESLMTIARRLAPEQAILRTEQAAKVLAARIDKATEVGALADLTKAWLQTAGKLQPAEAGARAARAAQALAKSMANTTNRNTLDRYGEALAPLLIWLQAEEAKKLAATAVQALAAQMRKPPPLGVQAPVNEVLRMHQAFALLAARLERDAMLKLARPAAQDVTRKLGKQIPWFDAQWGANDLIPLVDWLGPEDAAAAAEAILLQLGQQIFPEAIVQLRTAFATVVPKLGKQDLVDILKSPLCVGYARTVIVRELGRRAGQHFATMWDFVEWVRIHEPALDLLSPPRIPEAFQK